MLLNESASQLHVRTLITELYLSLYEFMYTILHRCGGLSSVRDWTDELSVGEQQRLSFARLIAHPVPLAFLDEATRSVILCYT
jgi:ABC-type uncharacterized transport system fused permease/ATPase subunit